MEKIIKNYTKIYRYSRFFSFDRDKKILEICKWKNVLHIWAWDAPYTEEKYNKWTLLHKKLNDVCNKLIWIELDLNSIEFLSKKWINNIIHQDLNDISAIDIWFDIDVIVFWETIEHIMNLKTFFDKIKDIMNKNTYLLISTPNMNYSVIMMLAFLWIEMVHYDHNISFSYWTLKQLIEKNDLKLYKYYYTFISRDNNSLLFRFFHKLSKVIGFIFPWLWETLLFVCIKK